ncbi:MAG: alkaline phosphatase family protein [Phycisphaerae bacterium]
MSSIEKVAVIGLDCAEPSLVFDRWVDHLPNIRRLMGAGTYGNLTSSIPPITVPAWSCMAAGKDPGTLGIYGFRNRADHSYEKLSIATSLAVKEPRIWDILGTHGKQSIVVGFPGTFPITRPINGHMITCFLTPDTTDPKITWTHPPLLKHEINKLVGEYLVDVKGFRTDDKNWLLEQIYVMAGRCFKAARYLLNNKPWDLFWMVDMGVDRIHHGFWSFMDKSHHRYEPGNEFENAIFEYYKYVDDQIGKLLDCMDLDKTAVWIVSDHGCKGMVGGCMFNQWLINEGYLHFTKPVSPQQKFNVKDVDWSKTTAWGEGGYYGRLFINVQGREPEGQIKRADYESFRDELIGKIEAIEDHEGKLMGNKCYKPEEIYEKVNRVAPDLVVIFGDLRWRSVGLVGSDSIHTFENDTGPDDANHAQEGMYLFSHPSLPPRGRVDSPTLYDVAPTILTQFSLPVPADMKGKPLC